MDSVNSSSRRVYETLPSDVQTSIAPLFRHDEPFIKTYLTSLLPENDHSEIDDGLRKNIPLVSLGTRHVKRKTRRSKGSISLSERRRLGLYQLRRSGSEYADALPLNDLWLQYIINLLSLPELERNGFQANPSDKQWAQVTLTLYRADYHGALLEVTRSKCSSLRGIKGIVLMDTKNTFKLIGQDNIVRTIPKSTCAFAVSFGGYKCTIFGKYFCSRPADRSVKKIKAHCLADL